MKEHLGSYASCLVHPSVKARSLMKKRRREEKKIGKERESEEREKGDGKEKTDSYTVCSPYTQFTNASLYPHARIYKKEENGKMRSPLFVTWHKVARKSSEPQLRGCIGTFKAKRIHEGLNEYALTSALNDRRFSPVTFSEISQLNCSVSLLTDFEEVPSVWDWEIGQHGIWIDFVDPNGVSRSGTYLPEVAGEQGWTKEEALESLVRKAGYKGAITKAFLESIKMTRYQSSKYSITYAEYLTLTNGKN